MNKKDSIPRIASDAAPAGAEAIPPCVESYLQNQLQSYFAAHAGALPAPGLYDRLLVRVEKPLIMQTLKATKGNQLQAARILGLNRNTLRKKMRTLGLEAKADES